MCRSPRRNAPSWTTLGAGNDQSCRKRRLFSRNDRTVCVGADNSEHCRRLKEMILHFAHRSSNPICPATQSVSATPFLETLRRDRDRGFAPSRASPTTPTRWLTACMYISSAWRARTAEVEQSHLKFDRRTALLEAVAARLIACQKRRYALRRNSEDAPVRATALFAPHRLLIDYCATRQPR